MNICKYLCHQKPERSFFYKEKQFPVCSRCTGIVIGAAAGFVLASLTQPNLIFVLGFIPLIIDGTTQYYGLRTSNNTLRFVTGLLCGFSIPFVVLKQNQLYSIISKFSKLSSISSSMNSEGLFLSLIK